MSDLIDSVSSLIIVNQLYNSGNGMRGTIIKMVDLDTLKERSIYNGSGITIYTLSFDNKSVIYYRQGKLYFSDINYSIDIAYDPIDILVLSKDKILIYNSSTYLTFSITSKEFSKDYQYDSIMEDNVDDELYRLVKAYRVSEDLVLFHKSYKITTMNIADNKKYTYKYDSINGFKQVFNDKFIFCNCEQYYIVNMTPHIHIRKIKVNMNPDPQYIDIEYVNDNQLLVLYGYADGNSLICKYYIDEKKSILLKSYKSNTFTNRDNIMIYDRERKRIMYTENGVVLRLDINSNDKLFIDTDSELYLAKVNQSQCIENTNKVLNNLVYVNKNIRGIIAKFICKYP